MSRGRVRLAVDMNAAAKANRSGVGNYSAELISALSKQSNDSLAIVGHYHNFLGQDSVAALPQAPNIRYRVSHLLPEKVVNVLRRLNIHVPFELLTKTRADVLLFPNYLVQPSLFKAPTITVIHDLAYLDLPETVSPKNARDLIRFVPWSIKHSEKVVAVSEFTKRQVIHHYQVNPKNVAVIYSGIDPAIYYTRPKAEVVRIRQQFNLPENYILFTGNLEPRKNILRILESYESLDKSLQNKYALVLAGSKGWLDTEINTALKKYGSDGANILQLGYVETSLLPALYSGASLFVYPSRYEGFGMPLLEAMACGTPVIAGNNSSQPEVVGAAGLLVDAQSTQAIAQAMTKLLTDQKLAISLSAKGLDQAKKFTWQKSAQALQKVINHSNHEN